MKKFITLAVAAAIGLSASAQLTFDKGDMVVDLGIGIGAVEGVEAQGDDAFSLIFKDRTNATFTQRLQFEYGLKNIDDWVIGIGAIIDNSYGGDFNAFMIGTYDYKYTSTMFKRTASATGNRYRWEQTNSTVHHREGYGTAKATLNYDMVSIMVKGTVHHQFIDNLDTYAGIALGVGINNTIVSNRHDEDGFSSASMTVDYNNTSDLYQAQYSYNDLAHAKWSETKKTKAQFAMGLYVGARYYFNEHWGVNAEFGLNSASWYAGYGSYSILNVGASYKF